VREGWKGVAFAAITLTGLALAESATLLTLDSAL
jgi:hypothetical protein